MSTGRMDIMMPNKQQSRKPRRRRRFFAVHRRDFYDCDALSGGVSGQWWTRTIKVWRVWEEEHVPECGKFLAGDRAWGGH